MFYKITIFILLLGVFGSSVGLAQVKNQEPVDQNLQPEFVSVGYNSFMLKNGLVVVVDNNAAYPNVTLNLVINNEKHSDFDKAGIDIITGKLLGKATKKISAEKFEESRANLKARFNFQFDKASAVFPKGTWPRALQLFSDAILDPMFNEEALFVEKRQLVDSLQNIKGTPKEIIERVGNTLGYGYEHPYGEIPSALTINTITKIDVVQHYQRYVVPQNATLYIKANLSLQAIQEELIDTFVRWKKSAPLVKTIPETENVQYTQFNLVNIEDAKASELQLTNVSNLTKESPDYVASLVAAEILSNYLITDRIRANAEFEIKPLASRFILNAKSKPENTAETLKEILRLLDKIRIDKVYDNEILRAKTKVIERFQETSKDREIPQFYSKLDSLQPNEIRLAAVSHFKTNEMRIIIVGDIRQVFEELEGIKRKKKMLPMRFYNERGARIKDPDFMRRLPKGASTETVFKKYIEAIGDSIKVANIHSLIIKAKGTLNETKLSLNIKKTLPTYYLSELLVEGNVMSKLVTSDTSGYVFANQEKVILDSMQIIRGHLKTLPFLEIKPEHSKLDRIETINEKEVLVVKFSDISEEYYDLKTGFKIQSRGLDEVGNVTVINKYSEYKSIEGILYPTVITQVINDTEIKFEVQEIIINPTIDPKDFE